MNSNSKTKRIAKLGVMAAVSVVLVLALHFPLIPSVSFLEYDPADVPIFLTSFAMGPGAGLVLTLVVSLIQGVSVSAASSWYGIVMHVIATGSFVLAAGSIYKRNKTKKMAIISLVVGSFVMAAVMIPANLLLTPEYLLMMGWATERAAARAIVKGLLVPIIGFNLLKASINAVITFVLYKRVSGFLHDK